MEHSPLIYKVALTLIPGIGDVIAKNLVSYCGSVERIFKCRKHDLLRVPGIDGIRAAAIMAFRDFRTAEQEMQFMEKNKIKPLFYLDDEYPARLKGLPDSPVLLFSKGNTELNSGRMIAIVGTRHATQYGKEITEALVEDLKPYDVTIISGLAYGIDICAHKAAIEAGIPTIGVLGHALNRLYPAAHRNTAVKMLQNGGLITEFKSSDPFDRENFPKRNRIVAGLADATIVIESAVRGGALITAEIANSYNRDVFAIPGKVGEKYSEGCNYFIKSNKANLVECAADVAYLSGWIDKRTNTTRQKEIFVQLDEPEKQLVAILKSSELMHIDEIARISNLFGSRLAAILLSLEFKGVVNAMPGKSYRLA